MPTKPAFGLAIRTPRDDARRQERIDLAYQWAQVDRDIAEALAGTILPTDDPPN